MTARRRAVPVRIAAALVALSLVAGCTAGGDGSYLVEAAFTEAVSLYEGSKVEVMGIEAGVVESITLADDQVEVMLRIDPDVPLPTDVQAAIVPYTLIGERTVVLHPAWRPGDGRAGDGHRIDVDRTQVPVEVDDALATFADLSAAIDAASVQRFVGGSAALLEGRGERFGAGLDALGRVAARFAEVDGPLLAFADDLSALAATLNDREAQVVRLIEGVRAMADVTATHQDAVGELLTSVDRFNQVGVALLDGYEQQLPATLASLADVGMVLRANSDWLPQLVVSLRALFDMTVDAYSPHTESLVLRTSVPEMIGPMLAGIIDGLVGGVLP